MSGSGDGWGRGKREFFVRTEIRVRRNGKRKESSAESFPAKETEAKRGKQTMRASAK